mmetsp:Transcript_44804/g.139413  ORF Transcript_44804/g.139413 Transcript_44804/m.139413 type:complete len:299 (-) Transcript_44804:9-905(-)
MAACADCASLTVLAFFAFSSLRSSAASPSAFLRDATSSERDPALSASARMEALPSCTAALRLSASSLSLLRVIVLLPISLSQKPSWSASPSASSWSLAIITPISFFTFVKGSVPSFCAKRMRRRLRRRRPSAARKSRTRCCPLPLSSCTSAGALGGSCAKDKCAFAVSCTSGDLRISTALLMASSSSTRSACFSSKDAFFSVHSVVVADSVLSVSALTSEVAAICLLSDEAFSSFRSFAAVLSRISLAVLSMESVRSSMIISCACLEFASSSRLLARWAWKLSFNIVSMSMSPPDWNS